MKRILAVLLCLLSAYGMMAQERKLQHRPYIDQRRFHYGFLFGVHMQDLELKNNGYVDPETGEQWYADVDNYSPGFSVGVLGEMRLNTYLSLRLVPTLMAAAKALRVSGPASIPCISDRSTCLSMNKERGRTVRKTSNRLIFPSRWT